MIETLRLYQRVLSASMDTLDLGQLDRALRECLQAAQLEESTLLPQMLLLDDRMTILNAIALAPSDFDDDKRSRLEQWGLSQLGYRFEAAVPSHATYVRLLHEATTRGGGYGHLFLSARDPVRKCHGGVAGDYDVFSIHPEVDDLRQFAIRIGRYDVAIASGYNAELLTKLGMVEWFQDVVLSVVVPDPGDIGSRMWGILAFLYRPIDSGTVAGKKVHDRSSTRIRHLYDIRKRIVSLSAFLQASQFASRMQSIGQASAYDPSRITTELVHLGWSNVLQQEIHRTSCRDGKQPSELGRLLTTVLTLPNALATRRILRDLLDISTDCSSFARFGVQHISQFLECAHRPSVNLDSAIAELRRAIPPDRTDHGSERWEHRLAQAIKAAIDNLRYFYRCLEPDEVALYSEANIVPFLRALLIRNFRTATLDSILDGESQFQLARTALEDVVEYLTPPQWTAVAHILHTYIQEVVDRTFLEGVVEIAAQSLRTSTVNTEPLISGLLRAAVMRWEHLTGGAPFRAAHKLFRLIPPHVRAAVLASFETRPLLSLEQFDTSHRSQTMLADTCHGTHDAMLPLQIISVVSSKGGVGKTTVAMAVAMALARRPEAERAQPNKVCLIDLDLFGPTLTYCAGHLHTSHRYLNEFVWAQYLAEQKLLRPNQEAVDSWLGKVFASRSYWRSRLESLCTDQSLLAQLLVTPTDTNTDLAMILCSPDEELQDLMLPFVESPVGRDALSDQIAHLLHLLKKEGFTHVVIDNSAEMKELAIDTTRLSSLHGGKTIFVTTLSNNAFSPLLAMLTSGHNSIGTNYLVINKLRTIDAKYIDDKEGVLDYLTAGSGNGLDSTRSYSMLAALLNVKTCGPLLWSEDLENAISRKGDGKAELYHTLATVAAPQVEFLL